MMENAVFLELLKGGLRPGKELFYYRAAGGKETDFVVKEGKKVTKLIQVCFDVSDPGTKKREAAALLKASDDLKCTDLLVITESLEGEENVEGKTIVYIPLWKWLLSG